MTKLLERFWKWLNKGGKPVCPHHIDWLSLKRGARLGICRGCGKRFGSVRKMD